MREASAEAAPRTAATSACKATIVELSDATVAMAESVRFGWRKMKGAGVSVSAMDGVSKRRLVAGKEVVARSRDLSKIWGA